MKGRLDKLALTFPQVTVASGQTVTKKLLHLFGGPRLDVVFRPARENVSTDLGGLYDQIEFGAKANANNVWKSVGEVSKEG